jgi:Raf kinase inhibitor-like YbhB/YbcL family protein
MTRRSGNVFELDSPEFAQGGAILARHAMRAVPGGENVSIGYSWSVAPAGTRSFALALVDRSPVAHDWVHWLVVDIPATATGLPEGASRTSAMPSGSRELTSGYGSIGYGGPQPPPGTGRHPYEATLYALDTTTLGLPPATTLAQFEQAARPHTLATAQLTGYFGR